MILGLRSKSRLWLAVPVAVDLSALRQQLRILDQSLKLVMAEVTRVGATKKDTATATTAMATANQATHANHAFENALRVNLKADSKNFKTS
jgi:hypothetical protein